MGLRSKRVYECGGGFLALLEPQRLLLRALSPDIALSIRFTPRTAARARLTSAPGMIESFQMPNQLSLHQVAHFAHFAPLPRAEIGASPRVDCP